MADPQERIVVYTDGACSGNPGPGGWAWAVAPTGPFASGAEARTTNQRMEITAAFEAVKANSGPLHVVSDSTYVVNCFRDRWYEGWRAKGWLNSQRKPVANRDLWEPFIATVEARGDVIFEWVKGHSDDPLNDIVDRLAVEAAATQQGRSGERLPSLDDLGPADAKGGRDARLPSGHVVAVFGHRPPELGGYGENDVVREARRQLTEILAAKKQMHPDLVVVSGLQLGAEQIGAEAARQAGVRYVAVQPYPEPDKVWPDESRRRYAELVGGAETVVLLERAVPPTKQRAGSSLARRDAWLARQADEAVVVWDGDDPGLARLVRSLHAHVGEENVWVVTPESRSTGMGS
jgi:ribonuclease HI